MKKVVTTFRLFLCRFISTRCQTNFQLVKAAERRDWFTDFAWLHCHDDGACHCSSCFWAIKSNRLSRKYKEGIQNSKWVNLVDGWQDYRKGKSAFQIHSRSLCHLATSNALQVRKTVFLFIFTFNLIYLYSFFDVQKNIAKFIRAFFKI